MSVSVVVVSHRPNDWLRACLDSVVGQCDELVVVDNASLGHQASDIADDVGATVVPMADNVGFAAGVNAGVRAVRTEHVALLNDDAFACRGWLETTTGLLDDDPAVAVVSPKLLFAWPRAIVPLCDPVHFVDGDARVLGRRVTSVTAGGVEVLDRVEGTGIYPDEGGWRWTNGTAQLHVPLVGGDADVGGEGDVDVCVDGEPVDVAAVYDVVNSAGSYLRADGSSGDVGFERRDDGRYDEPAERFAACGAALVTRRALFDEIGWLPDEFFTYYEDVDWCWRLRLAGHRIRYEPSAVVRHVHAATSDAASARFHYYAQRNRLLCLARNAPTAIVRREVTRLRVAQPSIYRSLARRLPAALAQRRTLRRRWTRAPEEVWSRWAGVDVADAP